MSTASRHSREEFARRGNEIYQQSILPGLQPADADKFVAIDIDSGQYEINDDDFEATERLLQRQPHAQIWLARVGQRTAYRIGGKRAMGVVE
jgi:hypothetical protein